MKFTSQQQSAIEARGSDLLVAAAAGSGKTAVLVERICALVREGVPIDSMLIVTFTNAAAAEMRQRITEAFEREGAQGDAFLAAQSLKIEHASISTLHRFCITVLRTHFQAAGVDPSFRTGDESETQVLRESAMQDAIDACFESGDENFIKLCECFRDDQLPELAFSLYRFMMSRPDPWEWLKASIDACDTDEASLRDSLYVKTLMESAQIRLTGQRDTIDALRALTGDPLGPVQYEAAVQGDAALLNTLLQSASEGYDALRDALAQVKYVTLPRKSGAEDKEKSESFKKTRETFKKAIKDLCEDFSQPLSQSAEDIASMTGALRGLQTLLRTFNALYSALKAQRNLLDYNDLEHLALKALREDAVADSLREKYAYIFVDEYQDSNAIQEALLTRIARKGGLFFVGDVKQSIYGFRQAEPSLFLSKYAHFSDQPGSPERKIDLNQNFRSRKNVLACVNAVFAQCMRANVTDIEYDVQARLYPGLHHPQEYPDFSTQVLILCGQEENAKDAPDNPSTEKAEEETEEESENLTRIEQEALVCAQRIHEIVGQKPIYDVKTDSARPARYRDIAILLRSMRVCGPMIVQLLAAQGIPAVCDAGEGYFDMPEVRQVLCLLQVIDNGSIDEALLASLHSVAVRLPEEALSRIRVAYPDESFSSACARYAQEKDDEIACALLAFDEKLRFYRLCARYEPLDVLVSRVMNESGLYARAGALPGGAARQANLRLLCQRAREYQRTQNGSLGGFLAYARKLRAGGDSQSAKLLSENEDVVRVMTMHKSKGLEFPIVFLLALGQRFNFRAHADPLLMHAQLGLGMLCYDTNLRSIRNTLSHTALKLRLERDALSEEVRVLYVAMTRARDQLYLVGSIKNISALSAYRKKLTDSALAGARTFLHFLLPVLLISDLQEQMNHPQDILTDDARWTLTFLPAPRTQKLSLKEEEPLSALLNTLETNPVPVNEISRRLLFSPSLRTRAQIKTSVTQLLREGEIDPALEPIHRLPQFMEQSELSGATRGTLFHTALREIDLALVRDAQDKRLTIQRQLDALTQRGIFTPQEREALSVRDIAVFFSSPMGARLLAAQNVRREWAFTWVMQTPEGETLVQGVVDCCFEESGRWILLDYKTDNGEAEDILHRYRGQIDLYARALTDITGMPVQEKSLYLVRRGRCYVI